MLEYRYCLLLRIYSQCWSLSILSSAENLVSVGVSILSSAEKLVRVGVSILSSADNLVNVRVSILSSSENLIKAVISIQNHCRINVFFRDSSQCCSIGDCI